MSKPEVQEIEIWLSEPQTAVLESRQAIILEMSGQGGGKSQNIGYSSGQLISEFPEATGFIGANTHDQLSTATLDRVFKTWKADKGFEQYDPKAAPWGAFVVDKRPPAHFVKFRNLRNYHGVISFFNGCTIFIGSLENYKAHEGKEFAWAHLDETKDTKEQAIKEVILGRLRQPGLWYDPGGALFFDNKCSRDEAAAKGWTSWNPLYIHTSPAIDGADWLLKWFKLDKFDKQIKKAVEQGDRDYFYTEFENKAVCIYSAYHNEPNLSEGFLRNQEASLNDDPAAILKLVHGYPFGQAGNAWFWAFRRDKHIQPVDFLPGVPVCQCWDFNSVPYMTCLCAQVQYVTRYRDAVGNKHEHPQPGFHAIEVMQIRFYKEYCLDAPRNSTEAVCEAFAADHDPREVEIFYYGDASGLHRIPGLGSVTNYKIIENALSAFMHNDSKKVKDPNVNPMKRRDIMNDIFFGKKYPDIEILIDPSMEKFIEDCENVKVGAAGKIKTKVLDPSTKKHYEKWGHTSDAAEYFVSELCKFLLAQ